MMSENIFIIRNLTLIYFLFTSCVRSPDKFCIFLEKREASLHEKMQRLPEEAGDPGDSLQCGGTAGYLMLRQIIETFLSGPG